MPSKKGSRSSCWPSERTEMTHTRRRVLGTAAVTLSTGGLALAGAAALRSSTSPAGEALMSTPGPEATPSGLPGFLRSLVHHLPGDRGALPDEGPLPAFTGATGW